MVHSTGHPSRRAWLLAGVALLVLLLSCTVVPPASAEPPGQSRRPSFCLPLSATGEGQDVSDPAEQGVVRTEGTISVLGYEVATSVAAFQITGGAPPILTFEGPLTIDPYLVNGTVTVVLSGSLDLSSGTTEASFSAVSTSVSGTGPLTGVSGAVRIEGVQSLVDGSFTETLTGELCVPMGRQHALKRALGGR